MAKEKPAAKSSSKSSAKSSAKSSSKSSKRAGASGNGAGGFTAEEREAMRERAKELKASRAGGGGASDEDAVLAKIAAMAAADRAFAERIHAIVKASAPALAPKLWYGMPAYAKNGKVVCFFQDARKFKSRYATLGFSDQAALDEGNMWPSSFALKEIGAAEEARIAALVKRAVG